jgi:hypothetical protein
MKYPLVRDLAAQGFPVRLTCGVLGVAAQPYYRWLKDPICQRDLDDAYLVNELVDLHDDDPTFGSRFLADEVKDRGHLVSETRVHKLCRTHRIWSTTTKKGRRASGKTPGPAVSDDLVQREFRAPAPNLVWLTDITEYPRASSTSARSRTSSRTASSATRSTRGRRPISPARPFVRPSPGANPRAPWWFTATEAVNSGPEPSSGS